MTKFEQFLLTKGYIRCKQIGDTSKFEIAQTYSISSLGNMFYVYFHNSENIVFDKIANNEPIYDIDSKLGCICFGLNEVNKPSTLIHPRPNILVQRIKDGKIIIEHQMYDDSMNVALNSIDFDDIFNAMFDENIILKIDLTD